MLEHNCSLSNIRYRCLFICLQTVLFSVWITFNDVCKYINCCCVCLFYCVCAGEMSCVFAQTPNCLLTFWPRNTGHFSTRRALKQLCHIDNLMPLAGSLHGPECDATDAEFCVSVFLFAAGNYLSFRSELSTFQATNHTFKFQKQNPKTNHFVLQLTNLMNILCESQLLIEARTRWCQWWPSVRVLFKFSEPKSFVISLLVMLWLFSFSEVAVVVHPGYGSFCCTNLTAGFVQNVYVQCCGCMFTCVLLPSLQFYGHTEVDEPKGSAVVKDAITKLKVWHSWRKKKKKKLFAKRRSRNRKT